MRFQAVESTDKMRFSGASVPWHRGEVRTYKNEVSKVEEGLEKMRFLAADKRPKKFLDPFFGPVFESSRFCD